MGQCSGANVGASGGFIFLLEFPGIQVEDWPVPPSIAKAALTTYNLPLVDLCLDVFS